MMTTAEGGGSPPMREDDLRSVAITRTLSEADIQAEMQRLRRG